MWDPTPREGKGADIAEDKVPDLLPEKKTRIKKKQEGSQRRRQGPQQRQEQSRRKLVGEHVKGCEGVTEMTTPEP